MTHMAPIQGVNNSNAFLYPLDKNSTSLLFSVSDILSQVGYSDINFDAPPKGGIAISLLTSQRYLDYYELIDATGLLEYSYDQTTWTPCGVNTDPYAGLHDDLLLTDEAYLRYTSSNQYE